jgi:putative heme-binding domain-containing protein
MRFPLLSFAAVLLSISSAPRAHAQAGKKEDPFQALVRPTEALTPQEEQTKLKVPPGFKVQLFASEPMIDKPINIAFDGKGRLWVTSNTEYPFPATRDRWEDPQGSRVRDSKDAIKILEDTDGDGVADKVTDFVDGLNVPIGVLPYGRGCIAWSIPNIWYFEDMDGDGKCDKRTVLFGPLGYEKDTHGNIASFHLGPDGWVYATHGFNNESHFEVAAERLGKRKLGDPGTVMDLKSGNTFRFRPDGSAIEQWTRGQVNPFGLCFDAWGQEYSADCHSDPITQLLRGCTYHSFSMAPGPLGFAPTMCPHRHGSTGLCGLVYVDRGLWGPEWDDHMFIGNCVTSRINHDKVSFTGSTAYATEQPDFLVPEDPWFRPVDLQFGPDHALYVADFYNKIIGHYEVDRHHPGRDRTRGRIWRIIPPQSAASRALTKEEQTAQEWRWSTPREGDWKPAEYQAAFATMSDAQAHPRIRRAVLEQVAYHPRLENVARLLPLIEQVPKDDPAMQQSLRVALRNHLQVPGAFAELDRVHPAATPELLLIIRAVDTSDSAAWLLRWLKEQQHLPADLPELLTAIARQVPPSEQGKFVTLLRERFVKEGAPALDLLKAFSEGAAVKGGARDPQLTAWAREIAGQLLAQVEQTAESSWRPGPDPGGKKSTSPWALDERKTADGSTIRVLSSLPKPAGAAIEKLVGLLTSREFACPPALDFWLCGHRGAPGDPPHELNYVRLVQASDGHEITRAYPPRNDTAQRVHWDLSASASTPVRLELVDGASGSSYAWLAMGGLQPAVVPLDYQPVDQQLSALADLVASYQLSDLAERVGAQLVRPGVRDETVLALATAVSRFPGQEKAIATALGQLSGLPQQRLAEVLASTEAGARQLLAVAPYKLTTLPGVQQKAAALRAPDLVAEFKRRAQNGTTAAALDAVIEKRLAGYQAAKANGQLNLAVGEQLFNTICIACHQLGGKGANIGPSLDGVKNRGPERLCEDILDPNRAVDPAFRLHVITLKDQSSVSGMFRREEGAALVIADPSGQERSIPKSDIAKREESALSLMPAGLADALPEEGFYNLLGWLMTK